MCFLYVFILLFIQRNVLFLFYSNHHQVNQRWKIFIWKKKSTSYCVIFNEIHLYMRKLWWNKSEKTIRISEKRFFVYSNKEIWKKIIERGEITSIKPLPYAKVFVHSMKNETKSKVDQFKWYLTWYLKTFVSNVKRSKKIITHKLRISVFYYITTLLCKMNVHTYKFWKKQTII